MNTKSIGNISEVKIISKFVELGIPVLIPFGDNEPYDIVVRIGFDFKMVQVKTGRIKNGAIVCRPVKRVGAKRLGTESYKSFGVHFLAVYCIDNKKTYLIPLDDSVGDSNISLRLEETRNNQIKNVRWAADYEFEKQVKRI